jgi:hypothetical protein
MFRNVGQGVAAVTVCALVAGSVGLNAGTASALEYIPPGPSWATKSSVTGTIQIRQVRRTPAVNGSSDMTVNLALPGPTYIAGSNAQSHSNAAMLAFQDSSSYDPAEQPAWCSTTAFRGFTDFASKAMVRIGTNTAYLDAKQGTIKARVDLTGDSTTARLTDTYCGGGSDDRYQPLFSGDNWRRGLFGAESGQSSLDSISPGLLTFRQAGGAWRSSGSTTRGFNDPGHDFLFGSNGTITITWNLSASSLTSSCLAPSKKLVRNKSVKKVRKVLRSHGFKSGKTIRHNVRQYPNARGVKRGRVIDVGYFPFSPRTQKCGTKIGIDVRK